MTFRPHTKLLIPDVHAKPGDRLERFGALAEFLRKRGQRIEEIIQIGDLWDFESLCTHDMEKAEWHQRSLEEDIQAGLNGLDHILHLAKGRNIPHNKITITEGNHEARYDRWFATDNRLATSGFPKTVKQLLKVYRPSIKLNYVPFLKPYVTDGAVFQHYFVSGLMGRAQGGERPASNLLKSQHTSCICGHSHVLDFAERTKADGNKIYALVAGSFVDPEGNFAYAGAARKLWWNGVALLHFTAPGEFDVETISLSRL